jgi:hypothetical protein
METDENGGDTIDCQGTPEPEVVEAGIAGAFVGSALMILGGILIGAGTPPDPKQNRAKAPPPRVPAPEGVLY